MSVKGFLCNAITRPAVLIIDILCVYFVIVLPVFFGGGVCLFICSFVCLLFNDLRPF